MMLILKSTYKGKSKVLQYFVDERHNLAVLDASTTKVIKMMNHTGLQTTGFISMVGACSQNWQF